MKKQDRRIIEEVVNNAELPEAVRQAVTVLLDHFKDDKGSSYRTEKTWCIAKEDGDEVLLMLHSY